MSSAKTGTINSLYVHVIVCATLSEVTGQRARLQTFLLYFNDFIRFMGTIIENIHIETTLVFNNQQGFTLNPLC